MLVGVTGTECSGRKEILNYLKMQGFKIIQGQGQQVIDEATANYQTDQALLITDSDTLEQALNRPFFLHLAVDASLRVRFNRQDKLSLDQFVDKSDDQAFNFAYKASESAHLKLTNNFSTQTDLFIALSNLNIRDDTRIRPTWDAYFMQLADLAARRSNCMKRRVGCVIVRNSRVMATGYNGTPRGLENCNKGGCPRCNGAEGGGVGLSTCLCLHAEENALLESGVDRVANATVYCNTCPCLTCTIKLVQCQVKEVVYSKGYYMDTQCAKIFTDAGVKLRQYTPP